MIFSIPFTAGQSASQDKNPGFYNQEASKAYHSLTDVEKESLRGKMLEPSIVMTKRQVKNRGSKIFNSIQRLVSKIMRVTLNCEFQNYSA